MYKILLDGWHECLNYISHAARFSEMKKKKIKNTFVNLICTNMDNKEENKDKILK